MEGWPIRAGPAQSGHIALQGSEALRLLPPQVSPESPGISDPSLVRGDLQLCVLSCPPSVTPDCCLPLHGVPRGDCRPGLVHGPQSVQVSSWHVGGARQETRAQRLSLFPRSLQCMCTPSPPLTSHVTQNEVCRPSHVANKALQGNGARHLAGLSLRWSPLGLLAVPQAVQDLCAPHSSGGSPLPADLRPLLCVPQAGLRPDR